MITENFFFEDNFMSDIQDLIDHLEYDDEEIYNLPDDFSLKCEFSSLEKIFTIDKKFVVDSIIANTDIWEDRFPEDSDKLFKRIEKAIKNSIDIDKLNAGIPELYYATGNFFNITKQDLIDYIS